MTIETKEQNKMPNQQGPKIKMPVNPRAIHQVPPYFNLQHPYATPNQKIIFPLLVNTYLHQIHYALRSTLSSFPFISLLIVIIILIEKNIHPSIFDTTRTLGMLLYLRESKPEYQKAGQQQI